ncbi:hypothetical protein LTR65_006952 [Meristemomyces frigidus]
MYVHMSQPDTTSAPPASKRKRRKPALSFCRGLVHDLDRADHPISPARHAKATEHNNVNSALISLPAEIRQAILRDVLDDHDLLHQTKINRRTKSLAHVCKTMQCDVQRVAQKWRGRREVLLRERGEERGAFAALIADFMAPVAAAAVALRRQGRRPRRRRLGCIWWDGEMTTGSGGAGDQRQTAGGVTGDPRCGAKKPPPVAPARHILDAGCMPPHEQQRPADPQPALHGAPPITPAVLGYRRPWVETKWAQQSAAEKEAAEVWRQQSRRRSTGSRGMKGEQMQAMAREKAYKVVRQRQRHAHCAQKAAGRRWVMGF